MNYVTLVIICHEHQSKLKYIYELHITKVIQEEFLSILIKMFTGNWVIFAIRDLILL